MGYTASLISAILLLTAHGNDAVRDSIVSSQVVSFAGTPDIRTIGESTISHLSASSAADVLRYSSSLQLKDYGGLGGLKTVNVRSLGSQHTSVFIDGIKVNNAQNGQVDLGRYSADDLQSVTLYSSGPSSLLASASELSAGSVVMLTTRLPDFSRTSGLDASLSYGSFISPAVHCSYSRRLSGKTYLKVLGDIRSTAGNYPFSYTNAYGADTTETRKNSDLFSYHLESAFHYSDAPHSFSAKAYWYSSARGLPGPVIRQSGQIRNGDRQWDRNLFVQGRYSFIKPDYGARIQAKYSDDYCRYLQDTTGNQSVQYLNLHYRQKDAYLSLSSFYRHGGFAVSAAWDGEFTCLSTDVPQFSPVHRFSSLLSLRADYSLGNFSVSGSAVYNHTDGNSSKAFDKVSPFISVQYALSPFRFLLWYKNSSRLPTFNELYYSASPVLDSALEPETADQYNFTVSRSISSGIIAGSVSLSLWYNRVRNKIVGIPAANQFKWSVLNYGLVKACGLSFSIDNTVRFRKDLLLSLLFNYDFNVSEDFTDPSSQWYKGLIPYSPLHSISSTVSLDYRKWAFAVNCIYNSARYRSVANTAANRLKAYLNCDITVSRTVTSWLRAKVELNNVFGTRYEIVSRYPLPGFNFRAGLIFKI